jgi:formate dehydrogenase (NADP+) beta subunit
VLDTVVIPCDDVILAIGQENAFPWIERDIGIEFDEWDMPVVDRRHAPEHAPGRLLRRRRGVGAGEHHLGGGARPPGGDLDPRALRGAPLTERPPYGMNLVSAKLGMHAWEYSNDYDPSPRAKMQHVELVERFAALDVEVELGFTPEQTAREVERCLNCDIQTHFTAELCIECDACIDVCPVNCLTITTTARSRSCDAAHRAGRQPRPAALRLRARSRRRRG